MKLDNVSHIMQLEKQISEWLGEGTKLIRNRADDPIFLSKDGLRRVRFDFKNTDPHQNVHAHLDIKVNGEWEKSGQLYPVDVPHEWEVILRILNEESKEKVDNASIFLTLEEAKQLVCDLKLFLDNPKIHHTHLSSEDYQKEITICIYDENNLEGFHPRAIKLIKEDE